MSSASGDVVKPAVGWPDPRTPRSAGAEAPWFRRLRGARLWRAARAVWESIVRRRRDFRERWTRGADVRMVMPTRSRVDAGWWFFSARVWVVCRRGNVTLLAYGPRPFVKTYPRDELRQSFYNPLTGELVLKPASGDASVRLRLPPLEGYRILRHVGCDSAEDPRTVSDG